jgi:hypothetical protein
VRFYYDNRGHRTGYSTGLLGFALRCFREVVAWALAIAIMVFPVIWPLAVFHNWAAEIGWLLFVAWAFGRWVHHRRVRSGYYRSEAYLAMHPQKRPAQPKAAPGPRDWEPAPK